MSQYGSLRELIADLGRHADELMADDQHFLVASDIRNGAKNLRIAAEALRQIAWFPDTAKLAQGKLKEAKYLAQIALQKMSAQAEDFVKREDA
jgi:hypothetical protein